MRRFVLGWKQLGYEEGLYETLGLVRLEKTTRAERMRIGKGGGSREPPANPTLRCIGKRYHRIKVATRDWAERENQRDQCGASPVLQVSMGTHFSGLAILEVLPTFENLMQASLEQP